MIPFCTIVPNSRCLELITIFQNVYITLTFLRGWLYQIYRWITFYFYFYFEYALWLLFLFVRKLFSLSVTRKNEFTLVCSLIIIYGLIYDWSYNSCILVHYMYIWTSGFGKSKNITKCRIQKDKSKTYSNDSCNDLPAI